MMRFGVMRCDVMRRDVKRCDAKRRDIHVIVSPLGFADRHVIRRDRGYDATRAEATRCSGLRLQGRAIRRTPWIRVSTFGIV